MAKEKYTKKRLEKMSVEELRSIAGGLINNINNKTDSSRQLDSCEYRASQQYQSASNVLEYTDLSDCDWSLGEAMPQWYCLFMRDIGFWRMYEDQPDFDYIPNDWIDYHTNLPNCVIGAEEVDISNNSPTGNTFSCTCNGITPYNSIEEGYYWNNGDDEQHITCNMCIREPGGTTAYDDVYGKCFNGNPPSWSASEIRILQDNTGNPQYGYCCDENAANYSGGSACGVAGKQIIGIDDDVPISFIPFPTQPDELTIPAYYKPIGDTSTSSNIQILQRYHVDEGRDSGGNTCPYPAKNFGVIGMRSGTMFDYGIGPIPMGRDNIIPEDLEEFPLELPFEMLACAKVFGGDAEITDQYTGDYQPGLQSIGKIENSSGYEYDLYECITPGETDITHQSNRDPLGVKGCSCFCKYEDDMGNICYPNEMGRRDVEVVATPGEPRYNIITGASVCEINNNYEPNQKMNRLGESRDYLEEELENRELPRMGRHYLSDFSTVGYNYGSELPDIDMSACNITLDLEECVFDLGSNCSDNSIIINTTIQNADDGDVICLPDGDYAIFEDIIIDKSNVTLKGDTDTRLYFGEKVSDTDITGGNESIDKFSKILNCLFASLPYAEPALWTGGLDQQLIDISTTNTCESYYQNLLSSAASLNPTIEGKLQDICGAVEGTNDGWRNSCVKTWAQSNHNGTSEFGSDDDTSHGYGLYNCYGESIDGQCELVNNFVAPTAEDLGWYTDCNSVGLNCNASICSTLVGQAAYYGCFKTDNTISQDHHRSRPSVYNMHGDYTTRACGGNAGDDCIGMDNETVLRDRDGNALGKGYYPFGWHFPDGNTTGDSCDYTSTGNDNYYDYPCGIKEDISASGLGFYNLEDDSIAEGGLTFQEIVDEFYVPGYCKPDNNSPADGSAGTCQVYCDNPKINDGDGCGNGVNDDRKEIEEEHNDFYNNHAVDSTGAKLLNTPCTYYESGRGDFECGYEKRPRDFCRETCGRQISKIIVGKNINRDVPISLAKSGLNKSNYIDIKKDVTPNGDNQITGTSIKLGDYIAINITMGEQVRIDHNVDYSITNPIDDSETKLWNQPGLKNGNRVPMFYRTVTKVPELTEDGNYRLTLDAPLRYKVPMNYDPSIQKVTGIIENIGIDNIKISNAIDYEDAQYWSPGVPLIEFKNTQHSWVKNIESFSDEDFARLVSGVDRDHDGNWILRNTNTRINNITCVTYAGVSQSWYRPNPQDYGWYDADETVIRFYGNSETATKFCQEEGFQQLGELEVRVQGATMDMAEWDANTHINGNTDNTDPPDGIATDFITKIMCAYAGGEDYINLPEGEKGKIQDWFLSSGGCLDSDGEMDYSKAKDSWDDIMMLAFNTDNPKNIGNESRHILSSGIVLGDGSKNITIKNCTIKLPQNRNEKNGHLFEVTKANEILIEDCEGYRGRHNFSLGGLLQTSGIVLNKIKSEGGWAFSSQDADYWSRYQQLEIPGLGSPGFSNTNNALTQTFLVTDSDLNDGFATTNRQSFSDGAGITGTDGVFWNVRSAPKNEPNVFGYESFNIFDRWKTMSVPGMGVLQSHQFGTGYIKDVNMLVLNDNNKPFELIKNMMSNISRLIGENYQSPSQYSSEDSSSSLMFFTPLLQSYFINLLKSQTEKKLEEVEEVITEYPFQLPLLGGCNFTIKAKNFRCPDGSNCFGTNGIFNLDSGFNLSFNPSDGENGAWLIEIDTSSTILMDFLFSGYGSWNIVGLFGLCDEFDTENSDFIDLYAGFESIKFNVYLPIGGTPTIDYEVDGFFVQTNETEGFWDNDQNFWVDVLAAIIGVDAGQGLYDAIVNFVEDKVKETLSELMIEDGPCYDSEVETSETEEECVSYCSDSSITDEEDCTGTHTWTELKWPKGPLANLQESLNSDGLSDYINKVNIIGDNLDNTSGTGPNDYIYGGIGSSYSKNWVCPDGTHCENPTIPQACSNYQSGDVCIERPNSVSFEGEVEDMPPNILGYADYYYNRLKCLDSDGNQVAEDSTNDCRNQAIYSHNSDCGVPPNQGTCQPDGRLYSHGIYSECPSDGGIAADGIVQFSEPTKYWCGSFSNTGGSSCIAASNIGCSYVGFYCEGDPTGNQTCIDLEADGYDPINITCGTTAGASCIPVGDGESQAGACICNDESLGCVKTTYAALESFNDVWSTMPDMYNSDVFQESGFPAIDYDNWDPNEFTDFELCLGGTTAVFKILNEPSSTVHLGYGEENLYEYQKEYGNLFSSNDYNRLDDNDEYDGGFYKKDGVYQSPSKEHINWKWYTEQELFGCTDEAAWPNYNPYATVDDGTCKYYEDFYGTGDLNGSGTVGNPDLNEDDLDLMSIYIECVYTHPFTCVPSASNLPEDEFIKIGDMDGDGDIDLDDFEILTNILSEQAPDYSDELEELVNIINFTLDNVEQPVNEDGTTIANACSILGLLTATESGSAYGHFDFFYLTGTYCSDNGSGIEATVESINNFFEYFTVSAPELNIPCSFKISDLISYSLSTICFNEQNGECDYGEGVCVNGSNEGLCCPYDGFSCLDYFSNIFNTDGYTCGDCPDGFEDCQAGNTDWPNRCGDTIEESERRGDYVCEASGNIFASVWFDADGDGLIDADATELSCPADVELLSGNFKIGLEETLETWLVIAEQYGYCGQNDCEFIRDNYCTTKLSDWSESVEQGCMDAAACNYDSTALYDNDTCEYPTIHPCWEDTDFPQDGFYETRVLLEFCSDETCEDQSIVDEDYYSSVSGYILGCNDPNYCEYNPFVTYDNGTCRRHLLMYPHTCYEDGDNDGDYELPITLFWCPGEYISCELYPGNYRSSGNQGYVYGCNDISACNYDLSATEDDGSCEYGEYNDGYENDYNCQDINVLKHFVELNQIYCPGTIDNWGTADAGCSETLVDLYNLDNETGEVIYEIETLINNSLVIFDGGNLVEIRMQGKGLRGSLPKEIIHAKNLKVLDVETNGYYYGGYFGGVIPNEIGELTELREFKGAGNAWYGNIPTSMFPHPEENFGMVGGLQNLEYLDLQGISGDGGVRLTGSIPENIGFLSNLTWLGLQRNQLIGEIPESIGILQDVEYFEISNNQLSGNIPEHICDMIGNASDSLPSNHPYLTNNKLCPSYPECLTANNIGTQDISDCLRTNNSDKQYKLLSDLKSIFRDKGISKKAKSHKTFERIQSFKRKKQ